MSTKKLVTLAALNVDLSACYDKDSLWEVVAVRFTAGGASPHRRGLTSF